MRGVPIGGEVAWHRVFRRTGLVTKNHFKTVIGERIQRRVRFLRRGTFGGERDLVPLAKTAVNENVLRGGGQNRGQQKAKVATALMCGK